MHALIAVNESLPSHHAFEWCLANLIPRAAASASPSPPHGPEVTKVTLITIIEPPVQASYYYAASGAVYTASFIDEVYQKVLPAHTIDYRMKRQNSELGIRSSRCSRAKLPTYARLAQRKAASRNGGRTRRRAGRNCRLRFGR